MTPTAATLPRIESAGIDGWMVRLFEQIDERNIQRIRSVARSCEKTLGGALVDLVPSYTTLLVVFDPFVLSPWEARKRIYACIEAPPGTAEAVEGATHELLTWYDPSVGPDLERVATHANLTVEDVIARHAGTDYRVFALGFAPGFAFMGLLDPALECPRHATPRKAVYTGSVAVTGRQTTAYPGPTPGGWNLIGRTAARLFDRTREPLNLLSTGDCVRFVPVERAEFIAAGGDTAPLEASQ